MEAARRLDEWKVLARKIPGVDYMPVLKPRELGEPVTLSPPEWNLIIRVDGRKSVEELARATNSNSFDTAKVLYGLVTSDLVDMRSDSAARGAGSPTAAAPASAPAEAIPARAAAASSGAAQRRSSATRRRSS